MQLDKPRSTAAKNRVKVVEQLAATTPAEREIREVYLLAEQRALAVAEVYAGKEAAEDVLHDVFVKLSNEWEELPPEAHTASYFIQCVRNRAVDLRRRESKYTELPTQDEEVEAIEAFQVPTPDPLTGEIPSIDVMSPLLARIPAQRRRALLLRLQGMKSSEVAAKLGIDAQVVRKYVRTAAAELIAEMDRTGIAATLETLAGLLTATTSEPTHE